MRFAVDIPNFDVWSDPRRVADFARRVEESGWDGLSIWDHIVFWDGAVVGDPWIALAAAATATERITLMTMVTPLPRRHPWKLARETVSLDHLSGGRFVLGVGLGWPTEPEFTRFHGETDLRVRGDMLDEGLEVLTGLWSGEPFSYRGEHYQVEEVAFLPTPLQEPRIPIWVAGMWPARRPFRRAARWDGVVPIVYHQEPDEFADLDAATLAAIVAYVRAHRESGEPFEVAPYGSALADPIGGAERIAAFAEAGATWWREGWDPAGPITAEEWYRRVLEGPPRPSSLPAS